MENFLRAFLTFLTRIFYFTTDLTIRYGQEIGSSPEEVGAQRPLVPTHTHIRHASQAAQIAQIARKHFEDTTVNY